MSLSLADIFDHLRVLLATDAALASIPLLAQVADATADAAAVRDYNKLLEAALHDGGIAIVALAAEGDAAADDRKPVLDLNNSVVLSIVENPKANTIGLSAWQIVRRVMRVCHRGNVAATSGARTDVRLSRPAYTIGPLSNGPVVYFVNLNVRTTEELGPIEPAAA